MVNNSTPIGTSRTSWRPRPRKLLAGVQFPNSIGDFGSRHVSSARILSILDRHADMNFRIAASHRVGAKRERRVFTRPQMSCIWRARRKRKRRPCHHVGPPGAVQPCSRQDEGYGARHLSDICRNFINCSKVLALSGERRSRRFNERLL
jgi:hypothetical protein